MSELEEVVTRGRASKSGEEAETEAEASGDDADTEDADIDEKASADASDTARWRGRAVGRFGLGA